MTLSPQALAVVRQTAPILGEHAEALTRLFYRRMFEGSPEVLAFFNAAHQHSGAQQRALAGAIVAYATHIDDLGKLGSAVELIAHKHVSLGIRPEHYPIVGRHLLGAIAELLGEAATETILSGWAEAYGFLADILIGREGELYQQHTDEHGWAGFRRFRVVRKVRESEVIQSLYLEPEEGALVAGHQPGQYLTVRVPLAGGGTTMRNYSISSAPGASHYRISVKREVASQPQAPQGVVSHHLHAAVAVGDVLEVGPPCGVFVLEPAAAPDRPLLLLSGGVGITPVLAMLHAAIKRTPQRPVHFVHAALGSRTHAFGAEVRELARQHPQIRVHVCYDQPEPTDQLGIDYDTPGRVNQALLETLLPGSAAHTDCYFCGPKPFMAGMLRTLTAWGAEPSQIRYEWFGPAASLASEPQESAAGDHATLCPVGV